LATSLLTVSSAFAQEHNFEDISQKIKNVSQGLAGQEAFDAVVAQATDLIAQLHVPGLAVGVIHGTNAYAAGIGVTNVRTWLPEAKRQRCTVHLQRNVLSKTPRRLGHRHRRCLGQSRKRPHAAGWHPQR
jgi:hypothetical protein